MRHLPTLLFSTLLAGTTAVSAADLATARTTLSTARAGLDADLPAIRASIDALDANRTSALGGSWALSGLKQIQDGCAALLRAAPETPARGAALAKLAALASAIDAFNSTSREGEKKWSAAHSSLQSLYASLPQTQAKLGELTPRLGSSASVAGEIESVTLDLKRKLQSLDDSAAIALSTHESQSAAWRTVFTRGQEIGKLFEQEGNFGSTPGLSGADMVRKMAEMNLAFLQLQEAAQMESRRFQTLSNASRARHDIALAAVRNLGS